MSPAFWLLLFFFIEVVAVMAIWTKSGPWYKWGAGRSVMGLLACLALFAGLGLTSGLLGRYQGRELVYLGAYILLDLAVAGIGVAIVLAKKSGRRKRHKDLEL
jgi:hypothetical protein